MSKTALRLSDPYKVQANDTLGGIARRSGVPLATLQRLNGIANPNKIQAGQTLYLSEQSAFGVSVVFLDALRHPVANLQYRLQYDSRVVTGQTGANGLIAQQVTKDARSLVEVWVKDMQGGWQQVHRTASDYGHKLITLVSDAVVIRAKTEPHPAGAPQVPATPKTSTATATRQAALPSQPSGSPAKNNPTVTTRASKGPQGQPVIEVGVKLPDALVAYFRAFEGGEISEDQWDEFSDLLECESAVLKAIAKVESGGRSAFWRLQGGEGGHVPAILYERHYFSRLTGGRYDQDYPDIAWPEVYRKKSQIGQTDKKMHDQRVDADDVYSDYATSYLRLIKAFELDANAALQSCSWGKFQIMGSNFSLCEEDSVESFVRKMCKSETGQIGMLALFIKNKPRAWKNPKNKRLGKEISMWDAVKQKNWRAIAFNYNGPAYAKYSYDIKFEDAYAQYTTALRR